MWIRIRFNSDPELGSASAASALANKRRLRLRSTHFKKTSLQVLHNVQFILGKHFSEQTMVGSGSMWYFGALVILSSTGLFPPPCLTVAIPEPVDDDENDLPDDPEEDDLLAVLLGPADQAEIRQQADDGRHKRGSC